MGAEPTMDDGSEYTDEEFEDDFEDEDESEVITSEQKASSAETHKSSPLPKPAAEDKQEVCVSLALLPTLIRLRILTAAAGASELRRYG